MKFGMALRDVGPLLTLYHRAVGKAKALESLKITSDIRSRRAQDIYVDRLSTHSGVKQSFLIIVQSPPYLESVYRPRIVFLHIVTGDCG